MASKLKSTSKLLFAGRRVLHGNQQQRLPSADLMRSYYQPSNYRPPPYHEPPPGFHEHEPPKFFTPQQCIVFLVCGPLSFYYAYNFTRQKLELSHLRGYERGYKRGYIAGCRLNNCYGGGGGDEE